MHRRTILIAGLATCAVPAIGLAAGRSGTFEVMRSDAEWRARLTEVEYAVLREHQTEAPYSSPLHDESRPGLYHCTGCDLPAYSSAHKYDSGTGWPSFWQSLPGTIGMRRDASLFTVRTEVHCHRCGSHFGHVFEDGPPPTGARHCLNGVSLTFKPGTGPAGKDTL